MKHAYLALSLGLIAAAGLSLTGCQIVQTPAMGWIFTDVQYGDTATTATAATKEGKACAKSILGWVSTGDATVAAAKAAGGITTVASVDHTAHQILGIIGDWCTIVKGS
ncbi:MAG: TRL-like family protein [Nitrospirota bacterium]|nr:TRL-like family protein [Nitrospirota bacterium]